MALINALEAIDDVQVWDGHTETSEPLDSRLHRSSRDNYSDDDNDSKSDDGFDDHDGQDGGGDEAYRISPFTEEAYFTHATQD